MTAPGTRITQRSFPASDALRERAQHAIPGGAHTYSKGDDQFPQLAPGFIVSGSGCRVVDVDGNRFLDWGMGLRSVILGHAFPRVTDAAIAALRDGTNFTRPAPIETEVAEQLIDLIPAAEMVKFAKNGSDVTTAAVRLARAATGRDIVAFPAEHPFYSVDDWFIGTTAVDAGVPQAVKDLSVRFAYGDLASVERVFAEHPGRIAAIVTEAATAVEPPPGFLEGLRSIATREGAVLVFDEMITGFRWDARGAQAHYGVTPDLATFGKAIGNGYSVSALVGRRDIMELGGITHDRPRVFLLSTTHGGETHALAAARETIAEIRERGTGELWETGAALSAGLNGLALEHGLADVVDCGGPGCSPNLVFRPAGGASAAGLRTLFLQETIARGVLIPYIAPSFSHDRAAIDETLEAADAAFALVARVAGGEPLGDHLAGPAVKPVFRRFNDDV